MTHGKLNGTKAREDSALEEIKARRAELSRRNDELLENDAFRAFLRELAGRAEYFSARYDLPSEWGRGYRDAYMDIVNGIVMNSSKGAEWLKDYATALIENKQERINRL